MGVVRRKVYSVEEPEYPHIVLEGDERDKLPRNMVYVNLADGTTHQRGGSGRLRDIDGEFVEMQPLNYH